MTSEAAHDALDVDRHTRELDAEETALVEDTWEREWHPTYVHSTYDPFTED